MKHGFLRVAAATPDVRVADHAFNVGKVGAMVRDLAKEGVKCVVFPELCLTGYTCGDLFLQEVLLDGARKGLLRLVKESEEHDALVVVGLPFALGGRLYNVAAVCHGGRLLGLVPKSHIPNYAEFYEARHFAKGRDKVVRIAVEGLDYPVPFGVKILFSCGNMPEFVLGVEVCEDLWMPIPPSSHHAMAGATVIANLSASDEVTGKDAYRKDLVKNQSARLVAGYIYADAGEGESTTDLVFSAHNLVAENGTLLGESARFCNESVVVELDVNRLVRDRIRMRSFPASPQSPEGYELVSFCLKGVGEELTLSRSFDRTPFVPSHQADRDKRCEEILTIQAAGLKKRLAHTGCEHAVLGISGGLDSTLALLVTLRAFDALGLPRKNIHAITMPCFGTTDRTYQNAVDLIHHVGARFREIPVHKMVTGHFEDIGHDPEVRDVTYENAQARARTMVLMDVANQVGGLVVGTGDMSELALGWATYNGDHMSMYGVNASVPKTLVRHLVSYVAARSKEGGMGRVLADVLDTPVSPELLPSEDGAISQKTEDLIGPYELHDFFLYYCLRFGFGPSKIYRIARLAFQGKYEADVVRRWLGAFYRRFFAQQYKRSCLPDGPKVGSVALSPRGDLRMPSDAEAESWLADLDA